MKFSELKTGDYFRFQSDIDNGHDCLHRKLLGPVSYLYTKTLEALDYPYLYSAVVLCDEKGKQIERLLRFSEIPDGSFFTSDCNLHLFVRLKVRNHMLTFYNNNDAPSIYTSGDNSYWKLTTKPDWLKINF